MSDAWEQARKEVDEEDFRAEVDAAKKKIRTRTTLWERVFPLTINIKRRKTNGK